MKLVRAFSLTLAILAGALSLSLIKNVEPKNVEAATQSPGLPAGGNAGSVIFIEGASPYFKSEEAAAVLYCYKSGGASAWSEKSNYVVPGTNKVAVTVPSGGGWTHFIICRYNPALDPNSSSWDGVYNKTTDLGFSSTFIYQQNTITITGYENNMLTISDMRSAYSFTHYGIASNSRVYLDTSSFTGWEESNAKFAIYFANPMLRSGEAWSSFMTKVEGSSNPHLYECTVPYEYGTISRVWNLVIPVRFASYAEYPAWYNADPQWNKTGDIYFDSTNHNNNIIRITGWESGEIKSETITREQRVEMYGQYFLDTVSCSGTGLSDSTTSEQWNAVKSQYQNMHTDYQGDVWTTIADSDTSASKVAQAMARYDYIVLYKQYDHEDFINRKDSPNKTDYNLALSRFAFPNENKETSITVIVLVSILSISSISVLLIVKRRKVN